MKSVKKFFIERMDSSDGGSGGGSSGFKEKNSPLRKSTNSDTRRSRSKNGSNNRKLSPQSAPALSPISPLPLQVTIPLQTQLSSLNQHTSLKKTLSASPTILTAEPTFPEFRELEKTFDESSEDGVGNTTTADALSVNTSKLKIDRHSTGGAFNFFTQKPQKGRRKISLPWFRQTSVSTTHAALSRQHTIDSPGSFKLLRQSSKVGNLEVTWVVADHTANPGTNELTVTKGQQVEILEFSSTGEAEFCLVRLNPQTDDGATEEGLVPISVLNPPPGSNKTKKEKESSQDQANRSKPDLLSSTKRRGFSGRKWLPPPLRKLSQGKVDKPAADKPLIKKASDKNLRLTEKPDENEDDLTTSLHNTSQLDLETEEEIAVELPPPMKPLQKELENSDKPNNLANNAPADLAEIEQIVKEKTEQHGSKFLKPLDIDNSDSCIGKDLPSCYSNNDNLNDNNDEVILASLINDTEAAQRKRMCALAELISTEEVYVQDLSDIVNGYIAEITNPDSDIPQPEDLRDGKERMVFANIAVIYEWHRDYFLKALQKCSKDPSELGMMIKKYEQQRKFHMYHVYCQNKPLSEHIVQEHILYFEQVRQKLKHRLNLSDLLIKPVQRITKYVLLLDQITKLTERAGFVEELPSLQEAHHVMKVACKTLNDMMDIRRLQKFEGKIAAQGKLLLHGPLYCSEESYGFDRFDPQQQQKSRELQVFLFEQSIIFSDIIGRRSQNTSPSYIYRAHIQVNKMQLEELSNNRFLLKSIDPSRNVGSFVCSAATIELHKEWFDTIKNILQSQHDFLRAIQSPIAYQKELTKDT